MITMKNNKTKLITGLFLSIILISCQKDNDEIDKDISGFSIEFSEGTTITEKDILYYDISTHILYLKEKLTLKQGASLFNVLVDSVVIYQGVIHPSVLSTPPSQPIFISDNSMYGNDIIQIGCYDGLSDKRSDQRIINALENSNLLHYGLKCTIDSINVTSYEDYSKVTCTITIKNNDQFNYYILDLTKMGDLKFNYYTGGLTFKNIETKISSFLRWSIPCDWSNLSLEDLSLLKSGEQINYTFESSDYYKMDTGTYEANYSFCGTRHNTSNFELNQKDGRIWVGRIPYSFNNIIVD